MHKSNFTVRLESSTLARLKSLCARHKAVKGPLTRSEIIRLAVEKFLPRLESEAIPDSLETSGTTAFTRFSHKGSNQQSIARDSSEVSYLEREVAKANWELTPESVDRVNQTAAAASENMGLDQLLTKTRPAVSVTIHHFDGTSTTRFLSSEVIDDIDRIQIQTGGSLRYLDRVIDLIKAGIEEW